MFKGVNRHEFDARRGTVNEEDMLYDITFFKQHNISAVRTTIRIGNAGYELCDEWHLRDRRGQYPGRMVHGPHRAEPGHAGHQRAGFGKSGKWQEACVDRIINDAPRLQSSGRGDLVVERDRIRYGVQGDERFRARQRDPLRRCVRGRVLELKIGSMTHFRREAPHAKPTEVRVYLEANPKNHISCEYMHAMVTPSAASCISTERNVTSSIRGRLHLGYIDQALSFQRLPDGTERLTYECWRLGRRQAVRGILATASSSRTLPPKGAGSQAAL